MIMDALSAIEKRRSISKLVMPGPNGEQLGVLIGAAIAAPDHAKLKPWRFIVLRGAAKDAFSDVFANSYLQACDKAGSAPDEATLTKERTKLERAPVVIVAVHQARPHNSVTVDEQRDAVAAAVENLLIAATALDFGTMWRTGNSVQDPHVRAALGVGADDSIVGFIYVGTIAPECTPKPRELPNARDLIEIWHT